ncbi:MULTISPECIES: hypothetical protein [Cohnella]|uniref:hypothetical protein n=1 Tax=Cohnella TaxID=329857 RepID=UPI00130400AF|nr:MULTISPECIES: hypothetical protein [Cohnella]
MSLLERKTKKVHAVAFASQKDLNDARRKHRDEVLRKVSENETKRLVVISNSNE